MNIKQDALHAKNTHTQTHRIISHLISNFTLDLRCIWFSLLSYCSSPSPLHPCSTLDVNDTTIPFCSMLTSVSDLSPPKFAPNVPSLLRLTVASSLRTSVRLWRVERGDRPETPMTRVRTGDLLWSPTSQLQ